MKQYKQTNQQGFTLIELLVVVAIIAIVGAVAIPSYQNYVVRANRSDAFDKLTEVMFQMERFKSKNRTYVTDLSNLGFGGTTIASDDDYYTISAAACGSGISRCVALTATAKTTPQTNDTGCTAITYNSQGIKGPADCW